MLKSKIWGFLGLGLFWSVIILGALAWLFFLVVIHPYFLSLNWS